VVVAFILKPRGLKGEMRLKPLSREPDELLEHPDVPLHIRRGRDVRGPFTMTGGYEEKGILIATFEGIVDRNMAETFVGCELVVRESDLWDLPDDTFLVHQLEGMDVVDAETGEKIGVVTSASEGAAHDFLELDLLAAPGRKTLLPLIPDFVPEIEPNERRVRVRIPDGLLDL